MWDDRRTQCRRQDKPKGVYSNSIKIALLSVAITGIIIPGKAQDHTGKVLPSSGLPISGIPVFESSGVIL